MELLQGHDAEGAHRSGALPWQEVVHYGRELAGALHWRHGREIVNRDIKPANTF